MLCHLGLLPTWVLYCLLSRKLMAFFVHSPNSANSESGVWESVKLPSQNFNNAPYLSARSNFRASWNRNYGLKCALRALNLSSKSQIRQSNSNFGVWLSRIKYSLTSIIWLIGRKFFHHIRTINHPWMALLKVVPTVVYL